MKREIHANRVALFAGGLVTLAVTGVVAWMAIQHNPQNVYVDFDGNPTSQLVLLLLTYAVPCLLATGFVACLSRRRAEPAEEVDVDEFQARLDRELGANDVTPPWERFPEYTATTIGWRMGGGEEWLWAWKDWFASLPSDEARLAHLQSHRPAPLSFVHRVSSALDAEVDFPTPAERAQELIDKGLLANDVAYSTYLMVNDDQPRPPWTYMLDWDVSSTVRYLTREFWFWGRWCAEQRATGSIALPTPPPKWADVHSSAVTGALKNAPDPEHGWLRLAVECVAAGWAPAPWKLDQPFHPLENVEEDADFCDAWMVWVEEAFDDGSTWTEYLERNSPIPPEWSEWVAKKTRSIETARASDYLAAIDAGDENAAFVYLVTGR